MNYHIQKIDYIKVYEIDIILIIHNINMHWIKVSNWRTVTKVPKGIFFGCGGNPIKSKTLTCDCADTPEKHMRNYKKYLFHMENYENLNMNREENPNAKGYYLFKFYIRPIYAYGNQYNRIPYPDELKRPHELKRIK